ncbi:uroplakin-3b [Triplophysa rosa]|uniref:Uroplakin-3b n=1 Tax=Triplophysa rosa TaxID=992332 RepID=A0A9W8CBM9_TRIRA|nr:uroplakin-3b [Triplophysa rosa]KAI7813539.1 uroplakin-3b precursor [Triplophysa rosa]
MPGVILSARHLQGFIPLWILFIRNKMFSCYRMKTNVVIRLVLLLTVCTYAVKSQTATPVLTPADLQAKITTNTVILKQPHCYFNETCPTCEIWLVPALSSATSTFDADRTNSNILSLSPYPSAFGPLAKNYFLTKVGLLSTFPCSASSDSLYFVVGADGNCTTVNCNGILPTGSVVRFKYVLVNGSGIIINETNWSANITLFTPQNPASIYDGFIARSGAMVVITTILSVAAGLLLLLFFIMLCVVCCRKKESKSITARSSMPQPIPARSSMPQPITVRSSMRMPRYDTHNLNDRVHPYDNPAYELEREK